MLSAIEKASLWVSADTRSEAGRHRVIHVAGGLRVA